MKLLSIGNDAKTAKGASKGFITGILYMAPAKVGGFGNVCPMASKGCLASCLFTAGRGRFNNVQQARINRKALYFNDRPAFFEQLIKEIKALVRKADKNGLTPCIRLNGTADIMWEKQKIESQGNKTIFEVFPDIQFYCYTKIHTRLLGKLPKNYHLTFSKSESNVEKVKEIIEKTSHNVAVVFAGELPSEYMGRKVVSGDETDLRFLDPDNCIVGLVAKGDAKKDTSGFVV